jgi:hypothetical protein
MSFSVKEKQWLNNRGIDIFKRKRKLFNRYEPTKHYNS